MISFERDVCTNLEEASSREWLETNGIGGFASSTVSGMNTRRYHGLLIAATQPPVGRMVLVSKLEETLVIPSGRFDLSTNRYDEVVHPSGYLQLKSFRLDPWPIYTYEIAGLQVTKSVFMVHGSNTTVVRWELIADSPMVPLQLEVRPLVAARDYHSTTHENDAVAHNYERQQNTVAYHPYDGIPTIHVAHNATEIDDQGFWYRNFVYAIEQERGLDFKEDLFSPFVLTFDLNNGPAHVVLSTETSDVASVAKLAESEKRRRAAVVASTPEEDDFSRALVAAADQFVVKRGAGHTIVAGYPWFTDWGRDTMVSLPGLTISTKRFDVARDILRTFSEHVSQGMLPNLFRDDGSSAEYNTVDAALWYFEAVRAYCDASGDFEFVREIYPVLAGIIDWHMRGTRYGIRVLDDGLLHAGVPGVQLTWMDAKVGEKVITPRSGKPVEIQALWYNALRIMSRFAELLSDLPSKRKYDDVSARLQFTFNRLFWNPKANCLYDVVNGGQPDGSIRPNQVLAVSLPHSMLSRERALSVLNVVEQELLTPLGLRTLSPKDPAFAPKYEGGPAQRDSAYHQGTAWPWLLGAFIQAYLKMHGNSEEARLRCEGFLQPLRAHLKDAGLGQISEICDATAPYHPGGCFAQAWSVAEILRAHLAVTNAAKKVRRRAGAMRVGKVASSA
jgi:predicted glycogen debranching enzyme